MKPYSEYAAEELAMERLFIRWVRFPDDVPIRTFWENWLVKHPHMLATVQTARRLVETASDYDQDFTEEEVGTLWSRIRNSLDVFPEIEVLSPPVQRTAPKGYLYGWSAGIGASVLIIILFWFFWKPGTLPQPLSGPVPSADSTARPLPSVQPDSLPTLSKYPHSHK